MPVKITHGFMHLRLSLGVLAKKLKTKPAFLKDSENLAGQYS